MGEILGFDLGLFWVLVLVELVALMVFANIEWPGVAFVSLVAVSVPLQLFGSIHIFSWLVHHPVQTIGYALVYFVAGTFWSIAKWWLFVRNKRIDYDNFKQTWLKNHNVNGDQIPDELKSQWINEAKYTYENFPNVKPIATQYKKSILVWMTYWPWSMFWTVLNDPVRKLFNQIYYCIGGLLQNISNNAFHGVENDLNQPTK